MAELRKICRILFFVGLFVFVTSQDPGTDPCAGNLCADGSTCYPASMGMTEPYVCGCPVGQTGMHCDQIDYGATDPCIYYPCGFDGTCIPNSAKNVGYECKCPAGQMGEHCEEPDPNYDPCSTSSPCLNEGSCIYTATEGVTCSCMQGYYGPYCGQDSLKVEVDGCGVHKLVEGKTKTFKDWCDSSPPAGSTHEPFSVRLYGMRPTENYMFEMIMKYKDQETVPAEQEVQGAASATDGDDITSQVEGLNIPAPDPTTDDGTTAGRIVCYNEDAYLYIRVTQQSDTSKFFETQEHRVTIQCDFKDTDLTVTATGTLGSITSVNDGTAILGAMLSDSSVTFYIGTVAGTSDPPLLGEDASYYVVFFLTKRPVPLPEDCFEEDVPEIAYTDTILWFKKFKTLDELSGVSDEIKGIELHAENGCGEYNGVLLVDPIYTIPGERCNNYIVIPITFDGAGCDATTPEEPRCAVINNPFENGRDSALTYHHHQNLDIGGTIKPDDRMFKFGDFATWRQELLDETDHIKQLGNKANKFGHGRLKLLEHDIRSRVDQGILSCSQTEEEARQSVKDIEELDPPDDVTVPTNVDMILADYTNVLTNVQQLKAQPASADALKDEARGILETMPSPENMATFDKTEKVMHWIKNGAYKALANITTAILDNSLETLGMRSRYTLCKVGDLMMSLKYMKKYSTMMEEWMTQMGTPTGTAGSGQADTMMYFDFAQQGLVENITIQMVMLDQFFPDATFKPCLDKVFKRIISFATGDLDEDNWLFGNCRKRPSNCLRKVKDFCGNHDDNCYVTTPLKEDKDLCVLRHFKEMVDREYKALGILDIKDWLREINEAEEENDHGYDGSGNSAENDDYHHNGGMPDFGAEMYEEEKEKGCSGEDPLSPKKGPLALFKWEDDLTLLRGVPKPNENIVCWNKVAKCTCQDCNTAAGTSTGKRKKK